MKAGSTGGSFFKPVLFGELFSGPAGSNAGFVVEFAVGEVVSDGVRPAEMSGFSSLIDFIVTARAFDIKRVIVGVRTYFTPIEESVFLVYGDSVRVSQALSIDLRSSTFGTLWVQVAFRNGIASVLCHFDTEDFSSQIVRVS
jgi:hypothetical protein